MANLYQRTSGGNFYIEWRDELGRNQRKSTGTRNRVAAEKLLREFERGGGSTTHKLAHLPLEQHAKDFITALAATTKPQQTKLAKERLNRVLATTGCTKIEQLTPSRVVSAIGTFRVRDQRFVQRRRKRGQDTEVQPDTDRPLSVRSKKFYLQIMRQFAKWLQTERRYPVDVLASLNVRHVMKMWVSADDTGESTRNRLTDEELQTLFTFLASDTRVVQGVSAMDRLRAYRLACNTGLRRTELSYLQPAWIDLGTGTLTVPAGRAKAKRRDTVVLSPPFVDWLVTWLPELPKSQEVLPRLRQINTGKLLRADLAAAGLPTERDGELLDFHCLRHTYCTRLWEQGLTVAEAVAQARHSDPKLTLAYTHVDQTRLRDKLNRAV